MAMPYGYAVWLCRMAMPYGYAVWLCRMAMPYGYAVWLCRMAMYCITESFACGTKSLMRGLMFEGIHLLFYIGVYTIQTRTIWRFTLMRNLIIGNMLSLGGERVLKFSELQLNDTPHTVYGFGGLKR